MKRKYVTTLLLFLLFCLTMSVTAFADETEEETSGHIAGFGYGCNVYYSVSDGTSYYFTGGTNGSTSHTIDGTLTYGYVFYSVDFQNDYFLPVLLYDEEQQIVYFGVLEEQDLDDFVMGSNTKISTLNNIYTDGSSYGLSFGGSYTAHNTTFEVVNLYSYTTLYTSDSVKRFYTNVRNVESVSDITANIPIYDYQNGVMYFNGIAYTDINEVLAAVDGGLVNGLDMYESVVLGSIPSPVIKTFKKVAGSNVYYYEIDEPDGYELGGTMTVEYTTAGGDIGEYVLPDIIECDRPIDCTEYSFSACVIDSEYQIYVNIDNLYEEINSSVSDSSDKVATLNSYSVDFFYYYNYYNTRGNSTIHSVNLVSGITSTSSYVADSDGNLSVSSGEDFVSVNLDYGDNELTISSLGDFFTSIVHNLNVSLNSVYSVIKTFVSSSNGIVSMIGSIFTMLLGSSLGVMISASLALVIVLRILGR